MSPLQQYYDEVLKGPIPFESLSEEKRKAVRASSGFAFWNLGQAGNGFVKAFKEVTEAFSKVQGTSITGMSNDR